METSWEDEDEIHGQSPSKKEPNLFPWVGLPSQFFNNTFLSFFLGVDFFIFCFTVCRFKQKGFTVSVYYLLFKASAE